MTTQAFGTATSAADLVQLPPRTVLSIEGAGTIEAPQFRAAAGALFALGRAVKRARTRAGLAAFKIGPLEARWWMDRHAPPLLRNLWHWRLRLAVPADVGDAELAAAVAATRRTRGDRAVRVEAARAVLEHVPGGVYGRVLHAGPWRDEPVSLGKIRGRLARALFGGASDHLEIYPHDPRRARSEALEAVLLLEAVREAPARAA